MMWYAAVSSERSEPGRTDAHTTCYATSAERMHKTPRMPPKSNESTPCYQLGPPADTGTLLIGSVTSSNPVAIGARVSHSRPTVRL